MGERKGAVLPQGFRKKQRVAVGRKPPDPGATYLVSRPGGCTRPFLYLCPLPCLYLAELLSAQHLQFGKISSRKAGYRTCL